MIAYLVSGFKSQLLIIPSCLATSSWRRLVLQLDFVFLYLAPRYASWLGRSALRTSQV